MQRLSGIIYSSKRSTGYRMSFNDRPTLSDKQMAGCIVYIVLGTLVVSYGLLAAALGDCVPESDGTSCKDDSWIRFALFPGTLILILAGGIFLARHMMKDRD